MGRNSKPFIDRQLISAGGFSQAITRVGHFYLGIKEPQLALRLCLLFVKWGCIACGGFAALGFALANHFHFFPASYLGFGCLNFIMLSALWMFCAMLSVQNRVWRIPLIFVIGGGVADGSVRVIGSRITLDTLVAAFKKVATAEQIRDRFPSLWLVRFMAQSFATTTIRLMSKSI